MSTHSSIRACACRALLFATLTGTAFAQTPAAKPAKALRYLSPDEVNPGQILAAPAPDGSEFQQKEMAAVRQMIKSRTPDRYSQATWDARHEDATIFASAIGAGFELEKLPATNKLLDAVLYDQAILASNAKDYFRRKFPVTAEMPAAYGEWTCDAGDRKPESRPLRSYPSGHATLGYSVGVVLANLIPEKSHAILARAGDYAFSREVCGDHYHSDVEASRALGTVAGVLLLRNARLKPLLEAARTELRTAGLTAR